MHRHLISILLFVVACAPPEEPLEVATSQPLSEATYAGRTDDANMFAAVITNADGIEAYLCDGAVDFWFRGPGARDAVMEFTSASGATLLLQQTDGRMYGRLVRDDGDLKFDLPEVQGEVLFRAETAVGEERVLGGWIRLPDGEQRGAVRVGTTVQTSVLGPNGAECRLCPVLSLTPAPFIPSAVGKRPNLPKVFTVVGVGDSFMSGEGAPKERGYYDDNGALLEGRSEVVWNDGLPTSTRHAFKFTFGAQVRLRREARACHRGRYGLGVAVEALRSRWPGVDLIEHNLACSGASVRHVVDTEYGGPAGCSGLNGADKTLCLSRSDDLAEDDVKPQLTELREFLDQETLKIDALVMSVGGNDLGFGAVIANCLSSPGGGCEAEDSEANRDVADGTSRLPRRYGVLGGALEENGVLAANVFLTAYPNPLRREANDLCAGFDFSDALLRFISDEEAVFANRVHRDMNELVAAGARENRWKLINSHVGTEVGHSACNGSDAWFNDTVSALRRQGADRMPEAGGNVNVSCGMVHPNVAGHRDGYAPAFQAALEAHLKRRFVPNTPTNLRVTKMELVNGRAQLTLAWNDVNLYEDSIRIMGGGDAPEIVGRQNADVTTAIVTLPPVQGRAHEATFRVKACLDTPFECSRDSEALEVRVEKPRAAPTNLNIRLSVPHPGQQRDLIIEWSDLTPDRMFTTIEYTVSGQTIRRSVEGSQVRLPELVNLEAARVASCNSLGCGPVTPWKRYTPPAPPCETARLNGCRQ